MNQNTTELTIMFADVAGSVQLHESLGDVQAHSEVVNCLNNMATLITLHHGRVAETIGDEIMCVFPNTDLALNAACAIQESLHEGSHSPLSVRIGFHAGPTALDKGHPFGDTVNVAARMVGIAKAGQIIISHEAYIRLSGQNRQHTRQFKRMLLKGKAKPNDTHEIVWDEEDCTKQYSQVHSATYNRHPVSFVQLSYGDFQSKASADETEFTFGRGELCNIIVLSDVASRLHASIFHRGGNFILADHSTNGTFVKTRFGNRTNDNQDLLLHHEEWVMASSGFISLGEPSFDDNEHIINFQCQ